MSHFLYNDKKRGKATLPVILENDKLWLWKKNYVFETPYKPQQIQVKTIQIKGACKTIENNCLSSIQKGPLSSCTEWFFNHHHLVH